MNLRKILSLLCATGLLYAAQGIASSKPYDRIPTFKDFEGEERPIFDHDDFWKHNFENGARQPMDTREDNYTKAKKERRARREIFERNLEARKVFENAQKASLLRDQKRAEESLALSQRYQAPAPPFSLPSSASSERKTQAEPVSSQAPARVRSGPSDSTTIKVPAFSLSEPARSISMPGLEPDCNLPFALTPILAQAHLSVSTHSLRLSEVRMSSSSSPVFPASPQSR